MEIEGKTGLRRGSLINVGKVSVIHKMTDG